MRRISAPKGQALVELLLLLPVLALLAYGMALLADVAVARLALIRVTREVAVFATRQESVLREAELKMMTRAVADRLGLNPWNINAEESPLENASLGGPAAGKLLEMAGMASRLTVEYRYQPSGPLRHWLRQGLLMRESVVLQANSWRDPGEQMLRKLVELNP